MKILRWLLIFALASPLLAQVNNVRWDLPIYTVQASGGNLLPVRAIPGALVSFYNEPSGTLANTYNSATSTSACPTGSQVVLNGSAACVSSADPYGNMGAWFQPGQYMATITGAGKSYNYYFTISGGGSGGGGVTSAQGTSPVQVNGASGTPTAGAVTISCPSCVTQAVQSLTTSGTGGQSQISGSTLNVPVYGNGNVLARPNFASLVGAFTDSSGNVIEPVALGNGPTTFYIPSGATQLQLGTNDTDVSDVSGSWTVSVNGTNHTIAGTSAPWVFTGGINSQYPLGASGTGINGATAPVVVPVSASGGSNSVTVQYVSGTITDGAICGGSGSGPFDASGQANCVITYSNTFGHPPSDWVAAVQASGGSGSLPTATAANQPIASTAAGTTYHALTQMSMDGTNVASTGVGACPVVGTPNNICITAAPYYASPYGATTTTGTFSALATNGTVGSCSTFLPNEGVLIAGGASGGWNGTSYIGTVVSCSGTTLTITPAITNAVTNATVQHDESAAILAAFTALNPMGGVIFFPNIDGSHPGVYLANGPLLDTSGANAIMEVPKIPNYSTNLTPITMRGPGKTSQGGAPPFAPEILTSLNTSGANLIGGYDSAAGGGYPNFTNVQLNLQDMSIIGPSGGSETLVNGTWILALELQRVSVSTPSLTAGSGNGVLMPTIDNELHNRIDDSEVAGFGTCVSVGEHTVIDGLFVNHCTNGVVADAAATGGIDAPYARGITIAHLWCGPATGTPNTAPSTVVNCIAGGSHATQINVSLADYEGTGTLVSDPSNYLHGKVSYNHSYTCPSGPTISGASNLVFEDLKCQAGGRATVTTGTPTAGHVAVFDSDLHSISDGGAAGGAFVNLGGSVTWSGCTFSGNVCTVGTGGNTITISSIPGTSTHLRVEVMGRVSDAANTEVIHVQLNGDTGANYDTESISGSGTVAGTTASAAENDGATFLAFAMAGASATANMPGFETLSFPYYSSTTFDKIGFFAGSAELSIAGFYSEDTRATQWRSTSAITSIKLTDSGGGNFASGTQVAIYGTN